MKRWLRRRYCMFWADCWQQRAEAWRGLALDARAKRGEFWRRYARRCEWHAASCSIRAGSWTLRAWMAS